ncbi:dihydropyrimidinase [Ancylobacter sp. A5.8]|uniref:dihydropyrimidinase n=1 Tax=Ancylobacter gelatini TaxID=2919920 RepID=UPI001F4E35AC|nr:dihydropyrimidinase [Ancylobacter gelatini]MCJ8143922.1 dihydropyrimidinase [Ancylobacter gelatini]
MHEIVVKGGRVGLPDGWRTIDIAIEGGKIAALGTDLSGATIIDARERWVLPGGIDAHCHLDQPSWGGATTADGFASGSASALFGGTTCIVPFAMPGPQMSTLDAVARSQALARGRSVVDYGLHAVVTEQSGAIDAQMPDLVRQGVPSVKAFLTYEGFAVSDRRLLAMMDEARAHGVTVMLHAESDAIIERMRDRLLARGDVALRYHTLAHAAVAEREATHRVAAFAEVTGARLVIVHVSSGASLDEVVRAAGRGVAIIGETCPQYLFLTGARLDAPDAEAARYIFAPPARTSADNAALWQAMEDGAIRLWSSDHSPYRLSDKLKEGETARFDRAVSGVPGLETRLPLLFSEGLVTGRLSLARYLDLAGGAAAQTYGLDHLKGAIAIGLDADLVLWNPGHRWEIRAEALQSHVGFTPFEGHAITGKPETALVRGTLVLDRGTLSSLPPAGRFVPRRAADPATLMRPLEETQPWRAS